MSGLDDLGLAIPLRGVQLIEASAGTGKTTTLTTLYARLVIECGLSVPQILAVTFTEMATKELRDRVRRRLLVARDLVEGRCADASADPAVAAMVEAAIEREGQPSLLRRLRLACEAMDLAPIHTIHGFCRRALADHALEAGQALLERSLVENDARLRLEVATDFWRIADTDADDARALRSLWPSPERLAASLRELLAIDVLLPAPAPIDGEAETQLVNSRRVLAERFLADGADARELLRQALANGVVNRTYSKDEAVDPVWRALSEWASNPDARDPASAQLKNYAASALAKNTNQDARSKQKKTTPESPLFAAIDAWLDAKVAAEHASRQRQIALIHRACAFARERLAALKRERGLIGYDDMIGDVAVALSGTGGDDFASRLRTQYPVALLDEFQDTDPRQWTIFQRLFAVTQEDARPLSGVLPDAALGPAGQRGLFLIGDPKQAIYRFRGGDVFTYLAAAATADARHALARNFRSRPRLLRAVQALFELSGADAFAQEGIVFAPVAAGERCDDAHFLRDGEAAPALTVLVLADDRRLDVDSARDRAATACVGAIHALLADSQAGRAVLTDRQGVTRAVAPGDIAVLVESNRDAARMQGALSRAGIPCAAAGRQSLYESDEAMQLRWLLEAVLAPADDQRLRAALATPLLGLDAAALAALDDDERAHRHWQDRLQHWRQLAERGGVLALLGELCAENAPRLLSLIDGERRLGNFLQLAEAMQAEAAGRRDLSATLAALERRIADADADNDEELLRLETDAARVTILTLHKSKGLEFEFVFLPFAATGGAARRATTPALARFHDGTQRVAHLFPDKDGAGACAEQGEERAERLRLLYVGLTRARLATWLIWGDVNGADNTPMAWLLHRAPGEAAAGPIDAPQIRARLQLLQQLTPDAIAVASADSSLPSARLRFDAEHVAPSAATATRSFTRDWWVYSFSQLSREDDGREARGADDEVDTELAVTSTPSRFSGSRFGNSLHAALEHARFPAWRDRREDALPPGETDALIEALRGEGYVSAGDLDEGLPLLARLVGNTLNTRLPEGIRLADLPEHARRSEMEFHFALGPIALDALLARLHAHDLLAGREKFGQRARIEGLMTGKIDLIYEHAGRFYLLDYKSNQLPDYGDATLAAAMHASEYTLQYLIYTLALHRWLHFRLGADYDYDRHFGGVRYLFCRGLDPARDDSPGIHAARPARALIEALDALLAPVGAEASA